MRRLFLAGLIALALPAVAPAKGPVRLSVCGPAECRDTGISRFPHHGEVADPAAEIASAPPPRSYYRLELAYDYGHVETGLYYEPISALVAYREISGYTAWSPLASHLGEAVEDAIGHVRPFPAPRVTEAWVGDRRVAGDASSYAALFDLTGPLALPGPRAHFEWIRLKSPAPNPWSAAPLAYYPGDGVLMTSAGDYVRLPAGVAEDVEAARALRSAVGADSGGWAIALIVVLGAALAGCAAAVLLRRARHTVPPPLPFP